jgi:hypothetical protein
MKRILSLICMVAILAACKKDKKQTPVTINSLQGTWKEELPISSSMLQTHYIFRGDSTFTMHSGGFVGTEQGTYRLNSISSDARLLDVSLTVTGSPAATRYMVEIPSHNKMVLTYGGTMGRTFVRQP